MRAAILLFVSCLFACVEGSGNGTKDTGGDSGNLDVTTDTAGVDGLVDDADDGGDDSGQGDGGEQDHGADGALSPVQISEQFLTEACLKYCQMLDQCAPEDGGAGAECIEDCVAEATTVPAAAKQRVCLHAIVEGDEPDFCFVEELCSEDYSVVELCEEFCGSAQKCGSLDGPALGYALDDCLWMCSAYVTFEEGSDAEVECFVDALKTCSGVAFNKCWMGPTYDACVDTICVEGSAEECMTVPALYPSVADCTTACGAWSDGQKAGAEACLGLLSVWPVPCGDHFAGCMEIAAELPQGALEYCQALAGKCGALGPDLGSLSDEACAWRLTGETAAAPDVFKTFDDALPCSEQIAQCPAGGGGELACLVKVNPDGEAACATLADVCTPATTAFENELTCRMAMALTGLIAEELVGQLVACVEGADKCETKLACFAPDQE